MAYTTRKPANNKLPGFIYTVFLVTLFSWIYLYYFIDKNVPENFLITIMGIFIFSITFSFTLSLILFFILRDPEKNKDEKHTYRKALKKAAYLGFGTGLFLIVKAFVLK